MPTKAPAPKPVWMKLIVTLEANYSLPEYLVPSIEGDIRHRLAHVGPLLFGRTGELCQHVYAPTLERVHGSENELIAALEAHLGLDSSEQPEAFEGVLDQLVHDVASRAASDVNNGGLVSQLEYLVLQGYTAAGLANELGD